LFYLLVYQSVSDEGDQRTIGSHLCPEGDIISPSWGNGARSQENWNATG
jgi:hypothetical protein